MNLIGKDRYSPNRCSCKKNLFIKPVTLNKAYINKAHKYIPKIKFMYDTIFLNLL